MRPGAAAVLLAGLATATVGCGSSGDCTEKATCPDPGDGAAGVDVPAGADGGHAGDAGQDGTSGADSSGTDSSSDGATSDVISSPDSSATCSGVCADVVPSGWSGPVTLFDQTGSTAPACPSSFPTDAYDGNAGLNVPNPTCGCTCSAGAGAQCGSSDIEFFQDFACAMSCSGGGSVGLPTGLCFGSTGCAGNAGGLILVPPSIVYAGTCSPQPTSSIPPATWTTTARGCATTPIAGSCSSGGVCVATPPSPFASVCIFQAGMQTCPGGSYSVSHVFYGGVSDSRACSTCSCGSPTGTSCTGSQVTLFGSGNCSGTTATVSNIAGCQSVGVAVTSVEETTAPTANNGSCAASGGQASGTATPATPTTVCCSP
jgi:hypothetical protein